LNSGQTDQPRHGAETQLAEFLAELAKEARSLGMNGREAGFLEGFLPQLPFSAGLRRIQSAHPTVVLLGARGVGKSTLFNWLAEYPLAPTGWLPTSKGTPGHSFVAVPDGAIESEPPEFNAHTSPENIKIQRIPIAGLPCAVEVHDPGSSMVSAGIIAGRANRVLFVTSQERYADRFPIDMVRWCAIAGCEIVPVLTLVDPNIEKHLKEDFRRILEKSLITASGNPCSEPVVFSSDRKLSDASGGIPSRQLLLMSPIPVARNPLPCIHQFLEVVAEKLKKDIKILTRAKIAIEAEAKSAINQFKVMRHARLRSTSMVVSAGRLLALLELPGHARLWSTGFRLMGWPLRQWLLGKQDEVTHHLSDAVVRRILGNWKGKVWLSVFENTSPSATEEPKKQESQGDLKKSCADEFSAIISTGTKLDTTLDLETNSAAPEWLGSKPGILAMARLVISCFQAICVVAALWYGGGGILSFVYLAIFAGLADMVLVIGVRVPLWFIELGSLRRWEQRFHEAVIKPFSDYLQRQIVHQSGVNARAIFLLESCKNHLNSVGKISGKPR